MHEWPFWLAWCTWSNPLPIGSPFTTSESWAWYGVLWYVHPPCPPQCGSCFAWMCCHPMEVFSRLRSEAPSLKRLAWLWRTRIIPHQGSLISLAPWFSNFAAKLLGSESRQFMLPKIFDDLHVCSMVWMFQLQKWVSPTILPQTNMAPSQDMFNIVDNLPTTLIFLGGNCWFERHYTFPLMATMISVMSESLCGGKPCPIKTEQFNWISPPNRSPNSPPNKNNWKIMENHFPKVLEEAEFCL